MLCCTAEKSHQCVVVEPSSCSSSYNSPKMPSCSMMEAIITQLKTSHVPKHAKQLRRRAGARRNASLHVPRAWRHRDLRGGPQEVLCYHHYTIISAVLVPIYTAITTVFHGCYDLCYNLFCSSLLCTVIAPVYAKPFLSWSHQQLLSKE